MKAKHGAAADVVLRKQPLAALHLPTVKAACEQVARPCASANLDYLGFLLRLCERYAAHPDSKPTVIFASATTDSPGATAAELIGAPVAEVTEDGSPQGARTVALSISRCLRVKSRMARSY